MNNKQAEVGKKATFAKVKNRKRKLKQLAALQNKVSLKTFFINKSIKKK